MPWVASSAVRRLQTAAKKPGTSSSNEFRKEVEDIRGINTKVSIFRDDVDVVLNYYCSVDLLNMAYMKKAYRVLIEDFNCETPQALAENEASFSEVFEIS